MVYYVYILHSDKDGKLYTGYTENLELRFEQHQLGRILSTKEKELYNLYYVKYNFNILSLLLVSEVEREQHQQCPDNLV